MQSNETTAETKTEPKVEKSPSEIVEGAETVRRIVDHFYDVMDTDPAAAGIHAIHAEDLGPMRKRLTAFLSGWLGGPQLYFQLPDRECIVSAHKPYAIGAEERDQWMMCIRKAMKKTASKRTHVSCSTFHSCGFARLSVEA